MKKLGLLVLGASLIAGQAVGAGFDQKKVYAGGGLGFNSFTGSGSSSFDSAIGYQFFGGYDFGREFTDAVDLGAEVGFMSSGDFTYSNCPAYLSSFCDIPALQGLWANALVTYPIDKQIGIVGRIGLDFGDDDGLMFGGGAQYAVNKQIAVRAEYVIRDHVNSLQGNVTYKF